jgi:hypothetical protein
MTEPLPNPWLRLPRTAPFVLRADRAAVDAFNSQAREEHVLHLNLLPIPFLGRQDAPIVLLNLNPGYHPDDDTLQASPYFVGSCRQCLKHSLGDYPFFFLDPHIEGNQPGPGHRWWNRILRPLLKLYRPELLAHALLCVEFFPVSFA